MTKGGVKGDGEMYKTLKCRLLKPITIANDLINDFNQLARILKLIKIIVYLTLIFCMKWESKLNNVWQ